MTSKWSYQMIKLNVSKRGRVQLRGCSLFSFPSRVWEQEFETAFPVPFSKNSLGLMSSRWIIQRRRWKFQEEEAFSEESDSKSGPPWDNKARGEGSVMLCVQCPGMGQSLWSTATNPKPSKGPEALRQRSPHWCNSQAETTNYSFFIECCTQKMWWQRMCTSGQKKYCQLRKCQLKLKWVNPWQ